MVLALLKYLKKVQVCNELSPQLTVFSGVSPCSVFGSLIFNNIRGSTNARCYMFENDVKLILEVLNFGNQPIEYIANPNGCVLFASDL